MITDDNRADVVNAVIEALAASPVGPWLVLPGPVSLQHQAAEIAVKAVEEFQKTQNIEIDEVWGLRVDGRVLSAGYSDRPLRSAEDVRSDFDSRLVERGSVVLVKRTYTVVE